MEWLVPRSKGFLKFKGFNNLINANSTELDLRNQQSVKDFKSQKPEYVFLAAAKVGGILAINTYSSRIFI